MSVVRVGRQVLLAAILGAAAGFLAGALWFASRPSPVSGGAAVPGPDRPPPSVDVAVGPVPNPTPEAPLQAPVPEPAPPTTSPEAALRSALASLPLPAAPHGTGVIAGRITDPGGEPLAGVVVLVDAPSAETAAADGDVTEPSCDVAVAEIEANLEALRADQAAEARAATGPDGTYRIERLASRAYRVRAWKDGWDLAGVVGWSYWPFTARPDATVDFTATPAAIVTLRLELPDGSAPDEAVLKIVDSTGAPTGTRLVRWTPGSSKLRLAAGGYTVTAIAGAPQPVRFWHDDWVGEFVSAETSVAVTAGSAGETVRIPLAPHAGARPSGPAPAESAPRAAEASGPELEIRALDPAGRPIVGARFAIHGGFQSMPATVTRARPDGTYVVRLHPDQSDHWLERPVPPEARWSLGLLHAAYGDGVWIPITPGMPGPVEFRLQDMATLTVRFPTLATSEFAKGVRYALVPPGTSWDEVWSRHGPEREQTPDVDGGQTFGLRSPGEYELFVLGPRPGMWSGGIPCVGPRLSVNLRPGPNTFDVPARLHAELTVHVRAADERSVELVWERGNRHSGRRQSVEGGRAEFRNLPVGRYWLVDPDEPAERWIEIRVPEQTEVHR